MYAGFDRRNNKGHGVWTFSLAPTASSEPFSTSSDATCHRLSEVRELKRRTHDLRDPSTDKIHLVHIRCQHIEVLGEGGLAHRTVAAAWIEKTLKHAGTGAFMQVLSHS